MNEENSPTGIETQNGSLVNGKIDQLSTDQKRAILEGGQPELVSIQKSPDENLTAAVSFMRQIYPYIEGRENSFRTESFSQLDTNTKTEVYNQINSTITALMTSGQIKDLEVMKGKIQLVGEPGISYENGMLNIGPGVDRDQIIEFLKKPQVEEKVSSNPEGITKEEPLQNVEEEKPVEQEKNEFVEGIKIDKNFYNPKDATEEHDISAEIDGALYDLEDEEKGILKSVGFSISIKGSEVLFPVFYEETKVLDVGKDNTGDDIKLAIRNTVIPSILKSKTEDQSNRVAMRKSPEDSKVANIQKPVEQKIETQPEPKPLEPMPEDPEALKEAQVEWKKEEREEWKKLEGLRDLLAQSEARGKSSKNITSLNLEDESLRANYEKAKEKVALMLRERLTGVSEGPLTKEQESLVNDTLFEELIKKENISYLDALREARINRGGAMVRIQEGMRGFLGQNAVQWYLKQNKYKRVAAISALAAIGIGGGMFIGGATASAALASGAGAFAYRGARGLASLGTMVGVGKVSKKSIEKIDREEVEKIEAIRSSNKSLQEKTEEFLKVKKEANKERKKIRIAMSAAGVVGGVGAGMATGAALDGLFSAYYGEGVGSTSSTLESKGGNPGVMQEHKLPARRGFGSSDVQKVNKDLDKTDLSQQATKPEVPKVENLTEVEGSGLFENPGVLKHKVEVGDSTWKSLGETVEKSKPFKILKGDASTIEAKKTFILSRLISENNLAKNLKVGEELDFTKVFQDKAKIEDLFKKAEALSESKIKNILENNTKISTWLADPAHKGVALTEDKVQEILNQPVKPQALSFNMPEADEIPKVNLEDALSDKSVGAEPKITDFLEITPKTRATEALDKTVAEIADKGIENNINTANAAEKVAFADNEVEGELEAARESIEGKKVTNIEEYKKNNGFRSLSTDSRKAVAEIVSGEAVERHLINDVDGIYGKKGFMGLGRVSGVNTPEWKEISGQNVAKVIDFYRHPNESDLPKKVIESLTTSQEHRNLVEHLFSLREVAKSGISGSDVVPYENETVKDYFRRLGKFLMEHPKSEIPNNVSGMSRAA